ncbi:fatty acid-binding protein, liver-like [Liolophura sinensis]|uniref:fatty acid-binding protein, liver-like n=1 Tax=Liolophura sinensis TaxID=3198878 RepID=UPI0031582601
MVMEKFIGTWVEEGKEGFEEFASALNLSQEKRQMYNTKTRLQYSKDGNSWFLTVGVEGASQERTYNFTPGQEYAAADIDGSSMTSLINIEDDKFVEKHTFSSLAGAEMAITREVKGDYMTVTSNVGGNVLVTRYKRV